jgi:hypothetical protein
MQPRLALRRRPQVENRLRGIKKNVRMIWIGVAANLGDFGAARGTSTRFQTKRQPLNHMAAGFLKLNASDLNMFKYKNLKRNNQNFIAELRKKISHSRYGQN